MPTLAQAFSASFQQVQWVVLAYLQALKTLIVSVGRLGDITGRRRLLLAGISPFALRYLPADRPAPATDRPGFDHVGTVLLALTLAAYALAMTLGRGRVGPLNLALLLLAAIGAGLFVRAERIAASPLIRLAMLRDRVLGASRPCARSRRR